MQVASRQKSSIRLETHCVNWPRVTFLNKQLFFLFDIPEPPSFIMRPARYMSSHRMEFHRVDYVFMAYQVKRFLELVLRVQRPQLDGFVGGTCGHIRAIFGDLTRHWMKTDVDYTISVSFQLSTQLAIWHAPNPAHTTPSTRREQFFIRRQATSGNTSIVSILRLLHSVWANSVDSLLQLSLLFVNRRLSLVFNFESFNCTR